MNQWSGATQQMTRSLLENLSFASRDGKVWCKHIDGVSGYMLDDDAIRGAYVIYSPVGEQLAAFETVETMLAAGWVLD